MRGPGLDISSLMGGFGMGPPPPMTTARSLLKSRSNRLLLVVTMRPRASLTSRSRRVRCARLPWGVMVPPRNGVGAPWEQEQKRIIFVSHR